MYLQLDMIFSNLILLPLSILSYHKQEGAVYSILQFCFSIMDEADQFKILTEAVKV